jgi:hypothetical protein
MFALFLLLASGFAQANDVFPIQYAYRSGENARLVVFQGMAPNENTQVTNLCGLDGRNCSCVFYSHNPNRKPIHTAQVKVDSAQNLATCVVPAPVNPELLAFGQLYNTFTRQASEKLSLRRQR